ncbi:MAG: DNA-binding protein [Segetibacter sp.]|nr:DNA-binding protein [Segetibacter sp.]
MNVICLQDEAFYALIDEVVARIKEKQNIIQDKWISGDEAMQKLRITSKTTLQKLRDTGAIRFSQPEKKLILYDIDSINDSLDQNIYYEVKAYSGNVPLTASSIVTNPSPPAGAF